MSRKKTSQKIQAIIAFSILSVFSVFAQTETDGRPPEGASCVVSVGNSNAPLSARGEYSVVNIPGDLGAVRARATCSDGSVGQSQIGFTELIQDHVVSLGPIEFGVMYPVPIAAELSAPTQQLDSSESVQMTVMAIHADGTSRDVTNRSEGTVYSISNDLIGQVSEDGVISVTADFDTQSSARIVASTITEGSASSTLSFMLGPTGTLTGTVLKADGVTPVSHALVSVQRLQPNESVATVAADVNGDFNIIDVNAGLFRVLAIDPVSGDQAFVYAAIQSAGEIVDVDLVLNGQGGVQVTVVNDANEVVPNAELTLTSLGPQYAVMTGLSDEQGIYLFEQLPAADFTISARDTATGLFGSAVGSVIVGETQQVVLQLQTTGQIEGTVLDVDGSTVVAGVQVRISSRQKGVISQMITPISGVFSFDTLPQSDGPFILDAFIDGRLRGRVPNLVFSENSDLISQNIILSAVGVVSGKVLDVAGNQYANAEVTIQSLVGESLNFSAYTNQSGEFVLPGVPVGDFRLTAVTESGEFGRAEGRINNDAETVSLDVLLASNTLVGTVYERDGVTPVAAGVTVYLAEKDLGEFYTYQDNIDVVATTTNELGQFGFNITEPGDFYIQAEGGLDRGRSQAVVVNLDPVDPYQVDVTYLAKGAVYGVVRDANGLVQQDVDVAIYSEGVFEAKRTVQTDHNGHYFLDGVFAGNLVLVAVNPNNEESALRYERLDAEGEQVEINVILSASGTVQGKVVDFDGSVIQSPVRLQVMVDRIPYVEFEMADGSAFVVERVPVGEVTIIAEEIQTGNKGIVNTRIDYQNDLRALDVTLIGQGSIELELTDTNGDPVADAQVKVSNQYPFRVEQILTSDANGVATFVTVNAGDFNIIASKDEGFGALQGVSFGTLLPNENKQLQIQMEAIAVGRISGVLYESDGVTPAAAGWVVKMLPEPFTDAYVTTTSADGTYEFPQVNAGTYDISVMGFYGQLDQCPTQDRNRAGAFNVALVAQDENVVVDLQLIGSGEVYGVVTDTNGQPVTGVDITLTNPDPFFGANVTCLLRTTYETTTNAAGEYRLLDIPPGNFTLLAENSTQTQRAEGVGRVRFDEDQVEINLSLIDNAITMPYDFYDANGFHYDINGDGSIGNGTRDVYGADAPDNGAMRLEIITNGVPVPFVNGDGTIGELSADGQEVIVDDETPSGLFVTRKIKTPRAGYFSRYLEVLFNPTDTPIEVGVRVRSHHRTDDANPRVVDSSDGDQVLSVLNPVNPDRWVVIDDQSDADPFVNHSIAASGHVFDGHNGSHSVALAQYELIGPTGRLTYQWDQVVVPPGEKVILMHFALGQIKRDGARMAADRIMSLPPEVMAGMTTDEKAAIINFAVPEVSAIEPLPNLTAGRITGSVLSGNGVNKVANATVQFVSQHPLFKRIRQIKSDASGDFVFESTLDGTEDNYVIPVFDFNLSAEYLITGATTAVTPGDFEQGETETTQDVIFIGAGDVRGNVLRHYGAPVADATVKLCDVSWGERCYYTNYYHNITTSEADGTYALVANTPRDYLLAAIVEHPQNDGRDLLGQGTVTVTASDVVVTDIVMEETGSVSGIVRSADNVPVSGAEVQLLILENGIYINARETVTDTAGFYRFYDVPVADFQIRVIDRISHATGSASISVAVDEEIIQDITLINAVLLNITAEYARGVTASGSDISFHDGVGLQSETTDTNGLAQFLVQSGNYQISAKHPDAPPGPLPSLTAQVPLVIAENDDVVDLTITLKPAGDVLGTIVRPDGTTLAGGFPYEIVQISGPAMPRIHNKTTNTGSYRYNGLPLGDYIITAYDAEQDRFADAIFTISTDGQQQVVDLTLLDERIALPADLFDANRFIYDIQQDGSMPQGTHSFTDGGSRLMINGEAFTGDTSAHLQAGKRQFAITQETPISGLNVSRKIYVPRGAYFARYIEVFDNPGSQDITIDVELSHTFAVGEIINTSSQDIILNESDSWFMIDDEMDEDIMMYGAQMPATAHVVAGTGSTVNPSHIAVSYINLKPTVKQTWAQITIPAGQTRSLMHVMVQQINRLGAETAVERLSQLPPELLTDLTLLDIESIINFAIPEDGLSTLAALPPLTGNIAGVVYEGDESTVVPATRVTVQSDHPLYSRVWGMKADDICGGGTYLGSLHSSDADGRYVLQGQLTEADSIAIPAGVNVTVTAQIAQECYEQYAGHPFTNVPSRVVALEAPGEQSVVFDTAVFTGSIVGSVDHAITSGRMYRSIDNTEFPDYQYTLINSDGSYVYPGVLPGTYDLLFDTEHPDKYEQDILRGSKTTVTIEAGQVLVSDINLQATGSVQGAVVAFDGAPSENAEVTLTGLAENQTYDQCDQGCVVETLELHKGKKPVSRRVYTDSLGRYNLNTIPVGTYGLQVADPVSGGLSIYAVEVMENQITTQNMVLTAVGSATVTVVDVAGNPVIDTVVYANTVAPGGEVVAGRTDFNGQFTVANIPLGTYSLRVADPRTPVSYFDSVISDEITTSGQNNTHNVSLKTRTEIALTVIDSDNSGLAVSNAAVVITDVSGIREIGVTDSNGQLNIVDVPAGAFSITVTATVNGIEKQKTGNGTITQTDNDSLVPWQIDLQSTLVTLPLNIRDANNNQYWLNLDNSGTNAPALLIDGEPFVANTSAVAQLDGRQIVINSDNTYSGLTVSRKAFVPLNGYFIRYQEIIENNTNSDVTVDLTVSNRVADGLVVSSSSGDAAIDNSGAGRDLWYVSRDGGSNRFFAFLGSDATVPEMMPEFSHSLVDSLTYRSTMTWFDFTIPANSRVQFMHFFVRQSAEDSAIASVQRLRDIPAETLVGMTAADVDEIGNFTLPADLISQLPALPDLNGNISGHVYEGDGVTPVQYVDVSITHDHVLYPGTIDGSDVDTLETDENGAFSITGFLSADQLSRPVPVGSEFTITASRSGGLQTEAVIDYPEGQSGIDVDLLFNTGSVQGALTGAFNYDGNEYLGIVARQNGVAVRYGVVAADFSYQIHGLAEGVYDLETQLGNFDSRLNGFANGVVVTTGQVVNLDIAFDANGAVSGEVTSSTGVQLPNQQVIVTQEGTDFSRTTQTNESGQYSLGAIPVGEYTITAINSETDSEASVDITVLENQTVVENLTFVAVGEVTITSRYQTGAIAPNLYINIVADTISEPTFVGITDENGVLVTKIPVGSYTLTATHPLTQQKGSVEGVVNFADEISTIDLLLPASANAEFNIVDANQGNAPIANATVRLYDLNESSWMPAATASSDVNGVVQFADLKQITYVVQVDFNSQDETTFLLTITETMDGQTVSRNVVLNAGHHQIQSFEYAQQSLLHQVDVLSGQLISFNSRVNADANGPGCAVKIQVFAPDNTVVAEGRAIPSGLSSQIGDLTMVSAMTDGRYSIQSSPLNSFCYSGEQFISAAVDGISIPVETYNTGGSVNGHVHETGGAVAIADELVRVQSLAAGPKIDTRTTTDTLGSYNFPGVPLGDVQVSYVPRPSVFGTDTLVNTGDQVTIDLEVSTTTNFNIRVLNDDGTAIDQSVRLNIRAPGQPVFRPFTNSSGEYTYSYLDSGTVSFSVVSPYNAQVEAIQLAEAVGGSVNVDLVLATATVSGVVYEADGTTAVANSTIRVYYAHNNVHVTQINSDAQGQYSFAALPIGIELILSVQDPVNSVRSTVNITLAQGMNLNQDIILAGRGTVFGRVAGTGDVPAVNFDVYARYVVDSASGSTDSLSVITDANGNYMIEGVPVGQSITVRYEAFRSYAINYSVSGSDTVSVINAGDSAQLDLQVAGASVVLAFTAADGLPVGESCYLEMITEIYDDSEGSPEWQSDSQSCDTPFYVVGIPGPQNITVKIYQANSNTIIYQNNWFVDGDVMVGENKLLSVITGAVTYFNGAEVPNVRLATDSGIGTMANESGQYRLLGELQGSFVITASDWQTGLTGEVTDNLSDESVPQVVNIQLQPSGSISGIVYDPSGNPLANTRVYAENRLLDFDANDQTDGSGFYELPYVALGQIALSTANSSTQNVVVENTELTVDGESKTVDLHFSETGSVTGTLTDTLSNPVSGGCVELKHTYAYRAYDQVNYSTSSNPAGLYLFDSVAPGSVLIRGVDGGCYAGGEGALVQMDILSGTSVNQDMQVGNATNLAGYLNDSGNNYRLRVTRYGTVVPQNNTQSGNYDNQPFTRPLALTVNGQNLNRQGSVVKQISNQQLLFGPTTTDVLSFERQIYAGSNGEFARLADKVTNIGPVPLTVEVKLFGRYGNPEIDYEDGNSAADVLLSADPQLNGGSYAIHQYNGNAATDPAVVGYVFAGNTTLIPVNTDFMAARGDFSWSWSYTIQPGDSAIFLSYLVYSDPGNDNIVNTIISELLSGTKTDMFDGISAGDLLDVINFEVP